MKIFFLTVTLMAVLVVGNCCLIWNDDEKEAEQHAAECKK